MGGRGGVRLARRPVAGWRPCAMIRHGLGIQGRREQAAALHHASRALSPPRPRLIQGEGEAEGCLTSCRMGSAVHALPHGPCIPRPCCAHTLLPMPCPHAPANTNGKRGKDCGGRHGFALCLHPCLLFRFFLHKSFYFYIIIYIIYFCEKKRKSRQKHREPLCRNGFRASTSFFLVPFLWTRLPLRT